MTLIIIVKRNNIIIRLCDYERYFNQKYYFQLPISSDFSFILNHCQLSFQALYLFFKQLYCFIFLVECTL